MRHFRAIVFLVLGLLVVGGAAWTWWNYDLRWRPHTVTKHQAEITKLLEQSGWASHGLEHTGAEPASRPYQQPRAATYESNTSCDQNRRGRPTWRPWERCGARLRLEHHLYATVFLVPKLLVGGRGIGERHAMGNDK